MGDEMPRIASLLAVLLALCGTSASAQEDWWQEIDRSGLYAAVGAGFGGLLDGSVSEPSGGMKMRGGWRFNRRIGAELDFEWLRHPSNLSLPGVGKEANDDSFVYMLNGKLYFPRWSNAEPYLLTGFGMYAAEGDKADFSFRFGGGFDLYFTRSVGTTWGLSYVLPTGDLSDADYLSGEISVFYRF